jgi:hypothetical protein
LLAELLFGVAFLAHGTLLALWFCSRCNGKCMKSIFAFVALVLYVAGFGVLLSFFRSGARKAPVQVDGVRWSYGAYIGFAGAAFYWTGFFYILAKAISEWWYDWSRRRAQRSLQFGQVQVVEVGEL